MAWLIPQAKKLPSGVIALNVVVELAEMRYRGERPVQGGLETARLKVQARRPQITQLPFNPQTWTLLFWFHGKKVGADDFILLASTDISIECSRVSRAISCRSK